MKSKLQKKFENRRLKGFRLLKKGVKQAEIARLLGISRQTVHSWKKVLEKNVYGWKSKSLGRPVKAKKSGIRKAASILRRGFKAIGLADERWTLESAREVINYYGKTSYSKAHVSKLLKIMGFSCKRPSYSNKKLFKRWVKYGWYSIDKKNSYIL